MEIEIKYCAKWNYEPAAASLAEELRSALGIESKLVTGPHGVFDVIVDGKMVFSKYTSQRLPEPGEISKNLK